MSNDLDKHVTATAPVDPLRKQLANLAGAIAWTVTATAPPVIVFVWRALL